MLSAFFIRRPVFAGVISLLTVLLGLFAMVGLPIERYPTIAPPTIKVSAVYPGADAATVAETVAGPIEREVNGVENMSYMSSVSSNAGTMSLTVTFEVGTDLDMANVLTQNRVSRAQSQLPEEVNRQGVNVIKASSETSMFVAFYSPDQSLSENYLSNYLNLFVRDEVARVSGVGEATVYGAGELSMRIWLDPQQMRIRAISPSEVIAAVKEQNVQVPAGVVGALPTPEETAFQFSIRVKGRLTEVEEFENIVVRTAPDGSFIRIKDIARVELGAQDYSAFGRFNGQPAAIMTIAQIPGSNLLDVIDGVKDTLDSLSQSFPQGLDYKVVYDATDVVRSSIKEVVITLFMTLILVVFTVWVFLQSWRATLIPVATIPVSLIGTFIVMALLGFSINTLTLFGLVLVIGIVVDDAIVVVENTTRHIEDGLPPKEAAQKAMLEVTGPVIATTLVLVAVFVPTAFISGITGILFKQFAITLAIATVFSSINALTLSPALCGILLRPGTGKVNPAFRLFNKALGGTTNGYVSTVGMLLRRSALAVIAFAIMTGVAVWGFGRLPTGFVPQEDEGYCIVNAQLPDAAALPRTQSVLDRVSAIAAGVDGVEDVITVSGFSLLDGAGAPNTGFAVVSFYDWSERPGADVHQRAIVAELNRRLQVIQDAFAFAFETPSLPGLGITSGFTYQLQDRAGLGLGPLQSTAMSLIEAASSQSALARVTTTFRSDVPQIFVDIDREQAKRLGLPLAAVFEPLGVMLGSAYVNDLTLFGRNYRVMVQADSQFRAQPEDIAALPVRTPSGETLPLGTLAEVRQSYGPQTVTNFNGYQSIKLMGTPAEGISSGEAMNLMEDISQRILPVGIGYAWSDLSYQEKKAAGGMTVIFMLSIIIVYLVLAAQYESWSVPLSVVLSVPTALLGAVAGVTLMGYTNNIYTQIGIVLLIGLATKTAILITEFARERRQAGLSVFDAAIEASRLRFRAVLMTAFSFILGVIPLLIASGAGAESRKVLGVVVFSGMLLATVLSVLFVPVLFAVIQRLSEGRVKEQTHPPRG